jgi:hypothetical protein
MSNYDKVSLKKRMQKNMQKKKNLHHIKNNLLEKRTYTNSGKLNTRIMQRNRDMKMDDPHWVSQIDLEELSRQCDYYQYESDSNSTWSYSSDTDSNSTQNYSSDTDSNSTQSYSYDTSSIRYTNGYWNDESTDGFYTRMYNKVFV